MNDRYQAFGELPGAFPTEEWWNALRRGIDGPLGSVLDVGCAEGVMSVLALDAGAEYVCGLDINSERIALATAAAAGRNADFWVQRSDRLEHGDFRTVILSMIAHWIGKEETARLAKLAERNVAVIFRETNEHYAIPENGTWFPTLEELDATIGGIRTHEEHLMTQDNGKRIVAATYRTDMEIVGGMVYRAGRVPIPLRTGVDLHGDLPFRPVNGKPVLRLSGPNADAVRELARRIAQQALEDGMYPSDFSPRNVIVGDRGAYLVDRDPAEELPHEGRVHPEFLSIWQATLSSIGITFSGDFRELL